jgi:hypothetical protein
MMKTKTVIISLICLVLIICLCIFIKSKYFSKPEKAEITQFLNDFKNELKSGHVDSLLNYFENGKNDKATLTLIKVLTGKTGLNGKSAPTLTVDLDVYNYKILSSNTKTTVTDVPVIFSHDGMDAKRSVITFTIHKIADHQFKIAAVKTDIFLNGYIAYANAVRNKMVPETAIFSPVTLAAFKTAKALKASYDSVLWFDHVAGKTYYYVIKGKLDNQFYWSDQRPANYTPTYKMGLVDPDLHEIIPPEYDLIHNIGGTIAGMIEVDKDNKRGLYTLDGKLIIPVTYDQIFPLNDEGNLALLRKGDDYFYFKKDSIITDKIADFKIADVLKKIKLYGDTYTLSDESSSNIMEFNDRDNFNSLIVSPSYLVDLQIQDQFINFPNKLRKAGEEGGDNDGILSLKVQFDGLKEDETTWFDAAFYSLFNHYLDGRSGLYETTKNKNVIIIDRKQNRLLGFNAATYDTYEDEDPVPTRNLCNESAVKAINDTLFEFKTTCQFDQPTLTDTINESPVYHYLHIKNGKLEALSSQRIFACTKFTKLDDSYLQGCYVINGKAVDRLSPAVLQYMKNEIYGSYLYKFKNDAWNQVFQYRFNTEDNKKNASVDDSLTVIDKYNINWLNQKLQGQKSNTLAAE